MQVHILHLYSGGKAGGVQVLFRRVVLALAAAGVRQTVILGIHEDAAPFHAAGIPVITARFRNRFTDLATHYAVWRAVRTLRPTLIQVWPHRANWFVRAERGTRRLPVVRFLGGPPPVRRLRKFYWDADALLVPGQGTADALHQNGWPLAKTTILRHFAPLTPAPPLPRPAGFLVAGVGRLSPEKGFDLLLAAVATCPDSHCWLVGDGPERQRLATLAPPQQVTFTGWLADPTPAIATADVVVVPSREESFGLVILEAWAQGRPVIATACDGPRALIQDGINGLLVPREDSTALAAAILRLRDDTKLRQTLGRNGHATVASSFTAEQAIGELRQFYQNVLESNAG
jgi:glycosyltransferase involved in cell wall biosynthesis